MLTKIVVDSTPAQPLYYIVAGAMRARAVREQEDKKPQTDNRNFLSLGGNMSRNSEIKTYADPHAFASMNTLYSFSVLVKSADIMHEGYQDLADGRRIWCSWREDGEILGEYKVQDFKQKPESLSPTVKRAWCARFGIDVPEGATVEITRTGSVPKWIDYDAMFAIMHD